MNTGKVYWKSQENVREFCQSGKVGTMIKIFTVRTRIPCIIAQGEGDK